VLLQSQRDADIMIIEEGPGGLFIKQLLVLFDYLTKFFNVENVELFMLLFTRQVISKTGHIK